MTTDFSDAPPVSSSLSDGLMKVMKAIATNSPGLARAVFEEIIKPVKTTARGGSTLALPLANLAEISNKPTGLANKFKNLFDKASVTI